LHRQTDAPGARPGGHRRLRHGLAPCLLASLAIAMPVRAAAADRVWLIGGGYDPFSSQAQIEQNVLWAQRVLAAAPGRRQVEVYFTDGDDPAPDVVEWTDPGDGVDAAQSLARVMDNASENGDRYRNHAIPGVRAGTEATALFSHLSRSLHELRAGDRLLIVYYGHGVEDAEDPDSGAVALWDESSLTVRELRRLLDTASPGVSVRFLFTQCFAGAFAGLADPGRTRCGFMAEAADREAEGCLASTNVGDYRDYGTYFFAAIDGRARDGSALRTPPDRDQDGRVTLQEAHFYALLTATSADLPRSTSEAYLLDWVPWYLRWARWFYPLPERDVYSGLAEELARAVGLSSERLARDLVERRRRLDDERATLERQREDLEAGTEQTRTVLENALLRRWPEVGAPYTLAYRGFLQTELDPAQHYLLARPEYAELVNGLSGLAEIDSRLVENERAATLLERIEHLRWLGRVRTLFEALAGSDEVAAYHRLLECEQATP
jgi:hypothetical protein